jgi:hypothetical protein
MLDVRFQPLGYSVGFLSTSVADLAMEPNIHQGFTMFGNI